MSETAVSRPPSSQAEQPAWHQIRLGRISLPLILLGLIVILAAALRFINLGAVGEANLYYTAAVKAMLQSWHNFFFAAAEPGGSVSVDKPPLGLWLQVGSAAIFGVNGFAVVLPQILAGIISVPLVYILVKRYLGPAAGLIAAFVQAVAPAAIAVEHETSNGRSGSGLGLTFCQLAVETHGGHIWIDSEVDRGTVVTFALPIRPQPQAERTAEQTSRHVSP